MEPACCTTRLESNFFDSRTTCPMHGQTSDETEQAEENFGQFINWKHGQSLFNAGTTCKSTMLMVASKPRRRSPSSK